MFSFGFIKEMEMTEPENEKTPLPPDWLERAVDDLNRQLNAEVVVTTEESNEWTVSFIPSKKPAG